MKPRIWLLLLVVLFTNCMFLPGRNISSTRQYNIYIEPGFSAQQKQSIVNAYWEWQIDTDETVRFLEVRGSDHSQPLITIAPKTHNELCKLYSDCPIGYTTYRGSDNLIYIATTDIDKRDFHETALHEIGHALGLNHDHDKTHVGKTVMTEYCNYSSPYLTCNDLQSFCRIWSCDAERFPLCVVHR